MTSKQADVVRVGAVKSRWRWPVLECVCWRVCFTRNACLSTNSPAAPPPPLAVGRRVDEAVDVTMLSCGRDGADRDGGGIVTPRSVRGHQLSLPSVVSDAGDRADSAATDG